MRAYIEFLRVFDWSFEFSDDGGYRRHQAVTLRHLRNMAKIHDPDGVIWNAYRPNLNYAATFN